MHRDSLGLIVQADGDGGDTCQRTGMYWFGRFVNDGKWLESTSRQFMAEATKLEVGPGILVRHPEQPDFRSDPQSTSRDQQDPLVVALGVLEPLSPVGKQKQLLNRIFRAHKDRFFKYQNKDIANPQTFGLYIRAFKAKWAYPFLFLTDLGLLFNAFVAPTQRNPDDTDDLNHIVRLTQAAIIMPTPVSWLARRLYARWRPPNCGSSIVARHEWIGRTGVDPSVLPPLESNHVMGALTWYFRAQNNGNPEIAETYRPIIAKLFSR